MNELLTTNIFNSIKTMIDEARNKAKQLELKEEIEKEKILLEKEIL